MKEDTTNRKSIPMKDANSVSSDSKPGLSFDDILVDSVDEVITEVVGGKTSSIFWRHYQAFIGVTRDEMSHQLPKLFESIQTIFGTGDGTVGERVIKKMYAKAHLPIEYGDRRPLVEYAEELKEILDQDHKTGLKKRTAKLGFH
jgi:hypothetical protein